MHPSIRSLAALVVGLCSTGLGAAPASEATLYRTSHVATLPGSGHSWGFAGLQPGTSTLFIARRENGLSLFDVASQRPGPTLANSTGANAIAFVPKRNRAYVANMDGSLSIIALDSLRVLKRLPVDDGNLNNLLYDPSRDRVIITSGRRGDHSTLFFLDPATDRLAGQRDIAALKLDGPIILGNGSFIVPLRDEDQVAVLDGVNLASQRLLNYPGCSKPSALAADEAGGHLFVACRGERPLLVIADLATGALQGTLPIGHAVNAMAYDGQRRQLLIPSGVDASLTVVEQTTPGQFSLRGAVGTRPWAHNMVFDAARGQVYLFSMDFTQPATLPGAPKADPLFHPDSFSILTLSAQPR